MPTLLRLFLPANTPIKALAHAFPSLLPLWLPVRPEWQHAPAPGNCNKVVLLLLLTGLRGFGGESQAYNRLKSGHWAFLLAKGGHDTDQAPVDLHPLLGSARLVFLLFGHLGSPPSDLARAGRGSRIHGLNLPPSSRLARSRLLRASTPH